MTPLQKQKDLMRSYLNCHEIRQPPPGVQQQPTSFLAPPCSSKNRPLELQVHRPAPSHRVRERWMHGLYDGFLFRRLGYKTCAELRAVLVRTASRNRDVCNSGSGYPHLVVVCTLVGCTVHYVAAVEKEASDRCVSFSICCMCLGGRVQHIANGVVLMGITLNMGLLPLSMRTKGIKKGSRTGVSGNASGLHTSGCRPGLD